MIKLVLKLCFTLMLGVFYCTPAALAERFLTDYLGKPVQELFAAEGQPQQYAVWDNNEYLYRNPMPDGQLADYMIAAYDSLMYKNRNYAVIFTVKNDIVTGVRGIDNDRYSNTLTAAFADLRYTRHIGNTRAELLDMEGPPHEFAVGMLPYPHDELMHEKLIYDVLLEDAPYDVHHALTNGTVVGVSYFCILEAFPEIAKQYALIREKEITAEFIAPVWVRRALAYSQENPTLNHWDLALDILDKQYAAILMAHTVDGDTPHLSFSVFFWDSTNTAALEANVRWSMPQNMAELWNDPAWEHGGDPAQYGIIPLQKEQP